MAITITNKARGSDAADRSSYSSASWTPTANRLLLAVIGHNNYSTPSLSGNGVTWTLKTTVNNGAFPLSLFIGTASSPSTGATTISFGASTHNQCSWSFDECSSDVDMSGGVTGAIIQTGGNTGASGHTVTLSAFSNTNNAAYGGFRTIGNITIGTGSGFTSLGTSTSVETSMLCEYAINDNTVDSSYTGGASDTAVACEIKFLVPSQIKKLSGVDQASIKKVMGVTSATAKKVLGVSNV